MLVARSNAYRQQACLTLTAIHPDGQHRTPSRHIPLDRPDLLDTAVTALLIANEQGWGAYVAVGLRRHRLTRYRRGGERDILALPAVFVDLDDASNDALSRIREITPEPSCITFTGGGYHAYWWLDEPLSDIKLARRILRGLQRLSGGDSLSPAQCLRLVGTHNTKPGRDNALCHIVEMHDRYYPATAFYHLLPPPRTPTARIKPSRKTATQQSGSTINPALLRAVTQRFIEMGYVGRGDWLSGPCLYPNRHHHADRHASFGFNTRTGYGNCYVCGSILLKDICISLAILPADYGGLVIST